MLPIPAEPLHPLPAFHQHKHADLRSAKDASGWQGSWNRLLRDCAIRSIFLMPPSVTAPAPLPSNPLLSSLKLILDPKWPLLYWFLGLDFSAMAERATTWCEGIHKGHSCL